MIEMVIEQRRRKLGDSFEVGRVLPFAKRRMVGPFIFFDHMGPVDLAPGLPRSADVRPHPHIGLSTVTYLFSGEVMHRDSLGYEQAIRPQEVNWMTAGKGITQRAARTCARFRRSSAWAFRPGWRCRPARKRSRRPSRIIPEKTCRNGTMPASSVN